MNRLRVAAVSVLLVTAIGAISTTAHAAPAPAAAVSVQESQQRSAPGIQQMRDGGMYITNAEATAVGAMYVLLDLGRHYLVEQVWLPGVNYVRYQVWYW
ncbi:hypothetical protein [Streptomyces albipurpureus]|uniref:Secreted protein n=1 Tax=Streptomyces albipurpureus TaxID=2897419 RepID=A0ABT0UGU6_9ACTN|nr:hypothetical protein [Streptomyces sp. CWNU-1]MCM2387320.1 hypothetical protein [Streptomyces sp. CWNU-1]